MTKMRSSSALVVRSVLAALALAFACTSCASHAGPAQRSDSVGRSDHDHAGGPDHVDPGVDLGADIDDPYFDASLSRLTGLSDLVVVGRVTKVESGVRISDDPVVLYDVVTVEVSRLLKGSGVDEVEVALLSTIDGAPFEVKGRPIPTVGDRGLYLLRKLAPEFGRGGFVLTNAGSLLPVVGDRIDTRSPAAAAQEAGGLGLERVVERIQGD